MTRKLPPFAAVRAFEAAARHLSFKAAAEELALSPSAISHQIRGLEDYLDTALFEREGNRMRLTLTGAAYAGRLTTLLDGMDSATAEAQSPDDTLLRVHCTPNFAARFLVPRLATFPGADRLRLSVSSGAPSTDFATNNADVVLHWGQQPVPGCRLTPLMQSGRYPVIAPDLKKRAGIARPADLLRLSLIRDETLDRWSDWARLAGLDPEGLPGGPVYPNCELATTAAEQGQGVAMAYDVMVRATLASGRLVRLFDHVILPITLYSIVIPEGRASRPDIRRFHDWLFAQVPADGRPGAPPARNATPTPSVGPMNQNRSDQWQSATDLPTV